MHAVPGLLVQKFVLLSRRGFIWVLITAHTQSTDIKFIEDHAALLNTIILMLSVASVGSAVWRLHIVNKCPARILEDAFPWSSTRSPFVIHPRKILLKFYPRRPRSDYLTSGSDGNIILSNEVRTIDLPFSRFLPLVLILQWRSINIKLLLKPWATIQCVPCALLFILEPTLSIVWFGSIDGQLRLLCSLPQYCTVVFLRFWLRGKIHSRIDRSAHDSHVDGLPETSEEVQLIDPPRRMIVQRSRLSEHCLGGGVRGKWRAVRHAQLFCSISGLIPNPQFGPTSAGVDDFHVNANEQRSMMWGWQITFLGHSSNWVGCSLRF